MLNEFKAKVLHFFFFFFYFKIWEKLNQSSDLYWWWLNKAAWSPVKSSEERKNLPAEDWREDFRKDFHAKSFCVISPWRRLRGFASVSSVAQTDLSTAVSGLVSTLVRGKCGSPDSPEFILLFPSNIFHIGSEKKGRKPPQASGEEKPLWKRNFLLHAFS